MKKPTICLKSLMQKAVIYYPLLNDVIKCSPQRLPLADYLAVTSLDSTWIDKTQAESTHCYKCSR